ncbi:MAG: 4-hydroxy-tetrahydrodipicolinate synthase [Rhodospirillales bacterium]|nr:4-hydroxy-tetrahydrodipicolinate synthase [Rhodospirillales bacterium]
MFKGSITALVTPFKNGQVDWQAFDNLIEYQIENGTHAVVPCGTTGESPTLSHAEHKRIVERCIDVVNKRVPVIAGTGSNNTAEAIELTDAARRSGADAALIVAPYYNKPTQDGLYAHYHTIAGAVNIPIIIYNIPGRSVIDISPETMARLAKLPNIAGVKDATGDLSRVKKHAELCGPDFCQLSGEDAMIYDYLEQGGDGCISVTSNIAPRLCADLHNAWIDGNKEQAKAIHERLMPLHEALFVESSPQPAKYALSRLGLISNELRLPLLCASEKAREAVDCALEKVGVPLDSAASVMQAHG